MSVFAARGLGVFLLSRLGGDDIGLLRGLRPLARRDAVHEEIHAIRNRRGQNHPLVRRILSRPRLRFFLMFVTLSLVFQK